MTTELSNWWSFIFSVAKWMLLENKTDLSHSFVHIEDHFDASRLYHHHREHSTKFILLIASGFQPTSFQNNIANTMPNFIFWFWALKMRIYIDWIIHIIWYTYYIVHDWSWTISVLEITCGDCLFLKYSVKCHVLLVDSKLGLIQSCRLWHPGPPFTNMV